MTALVSICGCNVRTYATGVTSAWPAGDSRRTYWSLFYADE